MLLMGLFSIFTGAIYNDMFSLSLHVFKSGFDWPTNYNSTDTVEAIPNGHVYPFGLDPVRRMNERPKVSNVSYVVLTVTGVARIRKLFAVYKLLQDETSHYYRCYTRTS